jgi:4-hydroxy-2-oxoheptanedioate aldolase
MKADNAVKEKLAKGEIVYGGFVFSGSPIAVEILGYTGFDFVYIDTEHTTVASDGILASLIRAADATGIVPIVRIKENQEHFIRNAIESGAKGLVIPHIASREDAERAVRWARFAPQGLRGANPLVRSAHWSCGFNLPEYIKKSNEEVMVIPLLEDKEFVDNLDDILSAEGIDAVSFGPMDYSLSSGLFDPGHADIKKLFKTVVKKAAEKNLQVLTAVGPTTLERVEELIDLGVRFLAMGADIAAIASNFGSLMQEIVLKTGRSTDTVVP